MKFNHENLSLIENWLDSNNLDVSLSDDFVRKTYHSVLESLYPKLRDTFSIKQRRRGFSLQYDFVRRDLLKILYKRSGNSASNIKAGYVYAISNPAWPEYVKIGSSIDVLDRLNSYQTSSPNRDYKLEDYYFVWDRRTEETDLHNIFHHRFNEWCLTSKEDVLELFFNRKKERLILPEDSKLYEFRDPYNTDLNQRLNNWYKVFQIEDDVQ